MQSNYDSTSAFAEQIETDERLQASEHQIGDLQREVRYLRSELDFLRNLTREILQAQHDEKVVVVEGPTTPRSAALLRCMAPAGTKLFINEVAREGRTGGEREDHRE